MHPVVVDGVLLNLNALIAGQTLLPREPKPQNPLDGVIHRRRHHQPALVQRPKLRQVLGEPLLLAQPTQQILGEQEIQSQLTTQVVPGQQVSKILPQHLDGELLLQALDGAQLQAGALLVAGVTPLHLHGPTVKQKNPEEHGRTANQAQGSIAQEIYQAGAQAYEAYVDHMRENEDVTVTTERMRRLCQETDDIANHSIQGLKEQNEKLEHLQDEMAEIHDDLNTSEKKMKQIKSFWGGFATMGSSRTHDQHQKMRVKDEKARDKMNERQAYELGKMEHQADKAAASANKAAISQHVHDNKKAIHQAKKENMAEAKAINKGRAEATEEKQVWGGHVFEMRVDGGGPKCQAEKDLDVISDYIHGFHEKAELMDTLAGDSTRRAQNVNSEVERATARTKALNKQADRYCGKK